VYNLGGERVNPNRRDEGVAPGAAYFRAFGGRGVRLGGM